MKINRKVLKFLKKKNLKFFKSKKPGVLCVPGKYESKIKKKLKNAQYEFQCWESFYNDRWTTFIKDMDAGYQNDIYDSTYDANDHDLHVELDEAFDYEDIGDPDLKEYWDFTYRHKKL